ncbi:MAG TPA: MmcQ/YjbR family DNA-binding protein [Polyangiaceae bacterium]|nr:MmcQ/YjbR family DNA-binding protein [Polyangiaceae bacterium]
MQSSEIGAPATAQKLLKALRGLAAGLPGAEEYVMVHHPAFRVGKKPFVIVGMDREPTISINLGVDVQRELLDDPRFSRTPYIGQHGWVTVTYGELKTEEVNRLLEGSWARVASKKHLAARSSVGAAARKPAKKTAKPTKAAPPKTKVAKTPKATPPKAKVAKTPKTALPKTKTKPKKATKR